MSIKTVCGDILTSNSNEKSVIVCHQVNMKGVMGAGLAKQIRNKFPDVYNVYKKKCKSGFVELGDVQFVSILEDAGYIVANIFGQDGYGRDKIYTDYTALKRAFATVASGFHDSVIRIPYRMGCGLAGGNWDVVLKIIQEELADKGVKVEIWMLPIGY